MRPKAVPFIAVAAFIAIGSLTYGASLPALLNHCLSKQTTSFSQTGDTSQSAGLHFIEVRRSLRNRRETFPEVLPVAMVNRFNPPALQRLGFIPDQFFHVAFLTNPDSIFHPPA